MHIKLSPFTVISFQRNASTKHVEICEITTCLSNDEVFSSYIHVNAVNGEPYLPQSWNGFSDVV